MDLTNLDVVSLANEGSKLELCHPTTGEILTDDDLPPKPFYVQLLGSDSDAYRNVLKRRAEKSFNNKDKKIDIDDAQRKGAQLLAKCTVDCYMLENGKVIDCNRDEMTRLYLRYPWMREQVEEFMGDRSNFIKS